MADYYGTEELEQEIFGSGNLPEGEGSLPFLPPLPESLEDGGLPALELELVFENGETLSCQAVGVFLEGNKQYVALHPKDDGEGIIHILELDQAADGQAKLLPVEDEAELKAAEQAFYRMIGGENAKKGEEEDDRDKDR